MKMSPTGGCLTKLAADARRLAAAHVNRREMTWNPSQTLSRTAPAAPERKHKTKEQQQTRKATVQVALKARPHRSADILVRPTVVGNRADKNVQCR
jgi:hypothetical protein